MDIDSKLLIDSAVVEDEIFARLRLKSLECCKCASKAWRSVINSPLFTNLHFSHHAHENLTLVLIKSNAAEFKIFDIKTLLPSTNKHHTQLVCNGKSQLTVAGCCNGLLCFYFVSATDNSLTFVLYNPSTHLQRSLCNFIIPRGVDSPYDAKIEGYGLGYDSKSKDYKCVIIVRQEVYIWSVRSCSYKKVEDYPRGYCLEEKQGVSANNALHWLYLDGDPMLYKGIFSIEMGSEKYFETPLPNCIGKPRLHCLRGDLHVVFNTYNYTQGINTHPYYQIDLWRMKNYDDSVYYPWVKVFSVELDDLPFSSNPISFSEGGRKVLLEIWEGQMTENKKSYVWYDLVTKESGDELHEIPNNMTAQPCLETLIDPQNL